MTLRPTFSLPRALIRGSNDAAELFAHGLGYICQTARSQPNDLENRPAELTLRRAQSGLTIPSAQNRQS